MIGNCVLSYKNAPRRCALGAGVDGCRSNRASARECAKAHSFYRCALGARGGLPPDSPIHTIDDLERNHDAGMNEYVAKTLESEKIIALITKYVVLK